MDGEVKPASLVFSDAALKRLNEISRRPGLLFFSDATLRKLDAISQRPASLMFSDATLKRLNEISERPASLVFSDATLKRLNEISRRPGLHQRAAHCPWPWVCLSKTSDALSQRQCLRCRSNHASQRRRAAAVVR